MPGTYKQYFARLMPPAELRVRVGQGQNKSIKRTLLFVLALIAVAPSSALSQRHNILGTTYGWDDGYEIISDIQISGLHIRRVRRTSNQNCPGLDSDHIEMTIEREVLV